jgi:hypothetical protein
VEYIAKVEERNQLVVMIRGNWLVLLLCLICFSSQSQVKYDFQSSKSFRIRVNGYWINQVPCERLVFEWKTAEKKTSLITYFSEDDSLAQSIVVKNGMEQSFQMQKVKDVYKWVLSGESPWVPSEEELTTLPQLDNIYNGDSHCQDPMSKDQFEQFVQSITASPISSQKIKTIGFLAPGVCCTVEQCVVVMNLFELEDDKLEVLKLLVSRLYDWDNRSGLKSVFLTERAQVKADLIIGQ